MSTGLMLASAPPDADVYKGLRISNLASDANTILGCVGHAKAFLIGHSYGVQVGVELLSVFSPSIVGFAMLEGVLKFTDDAVVSARPYACQSSPPCVKDLNAAARSGANLTFVPRGPTHWPQVVEKYPAFFQSCQHVNSSCMTQDDHGLRSWFAGLDHFSDLNGKVDALLSFDDITNDFTSSLPSIPTFIYGGERSLVPFAMSQSLRRQISEIKNRNTELDASFWLYGPEGNHCPFLNTEPTRSAFFQSLAAWMTAVQLASAA